MCWQEGKGLLIGVGVFLSSLGADQDLSISYSSFWEECLMNCLLFAQHAQQCQVKNGNLHWTTGGQFMRLHESLLVLLAGEKS